MTLRSTFQGQQLLFLAVAGLAGAPLAPAQAPAPAPAPAAAMSDVVTMQDNRVIPSRVVGVSGTGLQIQIGAGTVSLPLASIREVRMGAVPADFAAAQKALAAGDFPAAQTALRALDKYRGLPADWAQQATAMAGDLAIAMGDVTKAEAAYKDFQRLYPSANGGPQAEVGMARLAVAKKQFDVAKTKLEPIAAKALAEKNAPPNLAYAYSQTFYLLGQVKEADGDLTAALENYLRTTALFYADRTAVAQAQEKADALRRAHPEIFIP